jgi:amino acid adenylation domain-containing protein/non-ribosomal peptide synthase protein (TIGR01720 family)
MGVGPETLVAICVERSPELIVGILGILKAGAAYVPLDPGNPQARLSLVLGSAKPRVLVTRQELMSRLPSHEAAAVCLDTDWPAIERQSTADVPQVATADNLAYVIYTSGSTGVPKGTLITHRGLRNYLAWCADAYGITEGAGAPLHSSVAFDLSVTSIFVPLIGGGAVTIVPELPAGDGLGRLLADERHYGFIKLTPAHLQALALQVPPALLRARTRTVIVGGEALHGETLRAWWDSSPDLRVFNEYGPTETVVGSSFYEATAASGAGSVAIGRPIANTELYVLDRFGQPVPPGVEGELFIGGRGVARGYLNRPELTAEKFVPDAFGPTPGARLYRTGDVARWRGDGVLEYVGRGDQQVKIRGYRVELGDVEAALRQQPGVSEAVALLREDIPGDRRLVAYVVTSAQATGFAIDDLQERLRTQLPEYMVPAVVVRLDALPLSAIGKVDRRSLPAPSGERPTLRHGYAAPRTPAEATLAQVWAEVLRLERVGIHDNFFALGGDSILSLQVVARAMQLGWRFAPRQVFEHPTVAALAAVARVASGQLAAQDALVGPVPLTPIQHWFFSHQLPKPHHYNQAFRMALTPGALAVLDDTWMALQRHHDALRFRFARTDNRWTQTATPVETAGHISTIDLRGVAPAARLRLEERATGAVQASLDLANGPVARAVVLLTDATPPHLFLVLHHLVVDGVSWRILLADFELAGRQLRAGQPVALPPKSSSVRQWAEALQAAAAGEDFRAGLPFWVATSAPAARLPRDRKDGSNTIRASRTQLATLTREDTQALLQELPARGAGHMHDALLAGLVQALEAWTGEPTWRIDLEGHGREELPGDVDVSRTVGWFTSIYPVRLTAAARPLDTLRAVKTTLRDVPQNGLAYGVLRYLDVPGAEVVRDAPPAEILVNYLGQADQALVPAGALRPAGGPTGSMRDRGAPREYQLELNAIVVGGQLRLTLIHSTYLEPASVTRLADHLVDALRTLVVQVTTSAEEDVVAATEFSDLDLDEGEFERIARLLDD